MQCPAWISLAVPAGGGSLVIRTSVLRYLEMPSEITFSSQKDSGTFKSDQVFFFSYCWLQVEN